MVAHLSPKQRKVEGGYLINNKGERFMKNYHEKMELAPRDVVARAIEVEIREGRGYGSGLGSYVLCDVRHLGKEKIMSALPKNSPYCIAFPKY